MNDQRKRILLLTLKIGAGHIRAAQAAGEAIRECYDDTDTSCVEMLALMRPVYRRLFTSLYGTMIKRCPSAWKLIYQASRRQRVSGLSKRFGAWLTAWNSRRVLEEIRRYKPDAIVCTHFTAAEAAAAARRKKLIDAPVCVVITDFDLHAAWLHRGVDCYCVPTDEVASDLQRLNLHGASVRVTGIPISPDFAHDYPHRHEMRRALNIDPDRTTALLTGGGCGIGALDRTAALLLEHFPKLQILAVAGANSGVEWRLREMARRSPRLIPFGYVANMHELMAASDFIVTKPGGLTSSECLAMGLPAIVTRPIPGQEEHNSEYLVSNKVALRARNTAELLISARALTEDEGLRHYMSSRARSLARRRSAYTVADIAHRSCLSRASTESAVPVAALAALPASQFSH